MEQTKGSQGEPHAYRIVWREKTPSGRWIEHSRVEYADTQERAANAALAKIRRDTPGGVLVSAERLLGL